MNVILFDHNLSSKTESMTCLKNLLLPSIKKMTGFKQVILIIGLFGLLLTNNTFLSAQNPNWTPPNGGAFSHNASVIGGINVNSLPSNHINDRIAFFVGNQLRGLSTPVQVGSNVLHFVTVYANQTTETMVVKMYHHASNLVYDIVAPFSFVANNIYGSVSQPLVFNAYTINNSPLSINPIPSQQTIYGLPFNNINLNNYLVQPDPYPVVWTYTPNPNLTVNIINGTLIVSGTSTFTGQTTLTIRSTENGPFPPPQQFAERQITYNVSAPYTPPAWITIPNQGIVKGNTFQNVDLNVYEYQYGGPFLEFSYKPVLSAKVPPTPSPDWSQPTNFVNSMLLTGRVNYTPNHQFTNPGDKLAAFVNNQLRGVAGVTPATGLFFLSIGSNISSGEIVKLKLYSADMQEIIAFKDAYTFVSGHVMGSPANPEVIDFTPILPDINNNGVAGFTIQDTSFVGEVALEFTAYDSLYPGYLNDQTITKLCIVNNIVDLHTFYLDGDGDGFGNPMISIMACSMPEERWVDNNLDCNDGDASTIILEYDIVIQESAVIPNDGHICSGTSTGISINGGFTYLWSNGSTTSGIMVNPDTTTNFAVTITSVEGCIRDTIIPVTVETNVITSNQNDGPGSLRSVLECIIENGDVYFDQPIIDHTILITPLTVNKNVRLIGLSSSMRPYIGVDVGANNSNIQIIGGKIMTLKDVDIRMVNQTGTKPYFTGIGQVLISGITGVKED